MVATAEQECGGVASLILEQAAAERCQREQRSGGFQVRSGRPTQRLRLAEERLCYLAVAGHSDALVILHRLIK
jgi:hypothetical protein